MEEAFFIKWTEFQKNLSYSFNELREEGIFFDVTLVTDEEVQINAHRLVLSACSDFFKTILKKNPHSHPLIYLSGITSENLAYVLNYIYHGEVKISKNALYDFMKAAQMLKLQELKVDIEEEKGGNKKEDDEKQQNSSKSTIKVDVETDNHETLEESLNDIDIPENVVKTPKVDFNKPFHLPEESERMPDLVYEELKTEKSVDLEELNLDDWDYHEDLSSCEEASDVRFDFGETSGVGRKEVRLYIGDREFRRRRDFTTTGHPTFSFSCNGCELLGKTVAALVEVGEGGDVQDHTLKYRPAEETHLQYSVDITLVIKLINDRIEQEPAGRISEIISECLERHCDTMDPQARTSFLETFPTLDKLEANLAQARDEYTPPGVTRKRKNPDKFYYAEDGPLPEHSFQFRETIGRLGSKRGVPSTKVSLFIGNRVYKRSRTIGKSGLTCFSCNGCQKQGKYLSAIAREVGNEYILERAPLEKNHVCLPIKHVVDVKMAMKLINEKTLGEPNRSIREIYDEVKDSYVESMEPDMRESFLESIPKYEKISLRLWKKNIKKSRRRMIFLLRQTWR